MTFWDYLLDYPKKILGHVFKEIKFLTTLFFTLTRSLSLSSNQTLWFSPILIPILRRCQARRWAATWRRASRSSRARTSSITCRPTPSSSAATPRSPPSTSTCPASAAAWTSPATTPASSTTSRVAASPLRSSARTAASSRASSTSPATLRSSSIPKICSKSVTRSFTFSCLFEAFWGGL